MNILLICPTCGKFVNDAEELVNVGEVLMCLDCYATYEVEWQDYLDYLRTKEDNRDGKNTV